MTKSIVEYPGLAGKGGAGIAAPAQGALLHAVVVAVRHIDLAIGVYSHAPRPVEVLVITPRFVEHTQCRLVYPIAGEDLDALVAAIDHINVPIDRADRHSGRALEFVIAVAAAPEGFQIVAIRIENLDAVIPRIRDLNQP